MYNLIKYGSLWGKKTTLETIPNESTMENKVEKESEVIPEAVKKPVIKKIKIRVHNGEIYWTHYYGIIYPAVSRKDTLIEVNDVKKSRDSLISIYDKKRKKQSQIINDFYNQK